jgi:hypothetical protein
MAKLKEVRALKSSGVEPLAPTLIKRILHNLVLKAEDRRCARSPSSLDSLRPSPQRLSSGLHGLGTPGQYQISKL